MVNIDEIIKDCFEDSTNTFKVLLQEILARMFDQVNSKSFVGIRYLRNPKGKCKICKQFRYRRFNKVKEGDYALSFRVKYKFFTEYYCQEHLFERLGEF